MQYTLAQIAQAVGGTVDGDASTVITGVASIDHAGEGDLTFARDEKFFDKARQCHASAVVLPESLPDLGKPAIIAADPFLAFGMFLHVIAQQQQRQPRGAHPTAVVGEGCTLGEDVGIGAHAVIGSNVTLGDRVTIYPHAYVGDRVTIGDDSVIHANVSIREDVTIGRRCIIHMGAVIGADGFGYLQREGRHVKIPQVGDVRIGDDVEIGAQTTIDRAALDSTIIGNGVKMDNHCHVAHNCVIGDHSLLVAYARMGGGVQIGKGCMIGADARMVDNVKIGDGAMLAAGTGVMREIKPGEVVWGRIAKPVGKERRLQVIFNHLPEVWPKLMRLLKEQEG